MPKSAAAGRVPPANRLLAALPPREYARLAPSLELVTLPFKAVLYEPGHVVADIHFPLSGAVSVISPADGRPDGIAVGVVGREGVAGLPVFLGVKSAFFRGVVQLPGQSLRMRAAEFNRRVRRGGTLHDLLLRFTHAFLIQVSRTVACNSLCPVEKRLCRWLLAVHDRAEGHQFPLTHEFLAGMLGVRRASVSDAARKLRDAGLIRYGAGRLTVLDRGGLESAACGCYRVVQDEARRALH
jgi:CRP-like cAMP-binding protein